MRFLRIDAVIMPDGIIGTSTIAAYMPIFPIMLTTLIESRITIENIEKTICSARP